MKRLIAAVAAVSTLAGPTLALAQEHEHGGGHWAGRQGGGAPQQAAPQQPAPQQAAPQYRAPPQPQAQAQGGWRNSGEWRGGSEWRSGGEWRNGGGSHAQAQAQPQPHQWQGGAWQGRQGYQQPQVQSAAPGDAYNRVGRQNGWRDHDGYQGQNRNGYQDRDGWRGGYERDHRNEGYRGPRFGGQPFTYGGRSFYRYRAEPYRWGAYSGWARHGWCRGEYLPSYFFLPNYYISDWWSYGLWEPDYGLQWIRVGGDALLIDLATGEVVDVVPGVYYW